MSNRKAGPGAIYGTLDALVLRTLDGDGPLHGLEVARLIEERSDDVLRVDEGALYPALHRLQKRGLIEGEWQISEKRRRARFYEITDAGREVLRAEVEDWVKHTTAIEKVLGIVTR
jgi:PadR family transcriptional regulator PadR